MRILIFGRNGKVGSELFVRLLKDGHRVDAITRIDGDLSNPFIADQRIEDYKPEVVINATAYNGLEACVKDPELAFTINSAVPAHMAVACRKIGALFIHFSTDYVFGGNIEGVSLIEDVLKRPWGIYGFTKSAGEDAALALNNKTLVFRLSSIYGRSFSGPIDAVNQVRQGKGTPDNPVMVLHQECCPTSARLVADAIAHVLSEHRQWEDLHGVYHLSTSTSVWKKHFSEYLLRTTTYATPNIVQEGTLAILRPIRSVMNVYKFTNTFNYALPGWKKDLNDTLPLIK